MSQLYGLMLLVAFLAAAFSWVLARSLSHQSRRPVSGGDSDDHLNFCTKCAAPLVMRELGGYRRKACPSDEPGHFVNWNNPKPVAIVRIPRPGNKLLMIKRGVEPAIGKWAFPGGYAEGFREPDQAAETVEENGVREVLEEAGIHVSIARWVSNFGTKNRSNTQVHVLDAFANSDPAQAGDDALEVRDFGEGELSPDETAFPSHYQAFQDYFSTCR